MYPELHFDCLKETETILRQTENMRKRWSEVHEKVFEWIHFYVNRPWQIKRITVKTEQLILKGSRNTPRSCEGEVYPKERDVIHIRMGKRVNGGGSKVLGYLIHEIIHSLVMSAPDYRFKEPGDLEEWILDELATDLLAQHVAHKVFGKKVRTIDSVQYALYEVSRRIAIDKEYKTVRDKIIKTINRAMRNYLKTNKNYFSLRQELIKI